jgi:hypothetical protein
LRIKSVWKEQVMESKITKALGLRYNPQFIEELPIVDIPAKYFVFKPFRGIWKTLMESKEE